MARGCGAGMWPPELPLLQEQQQEEQHEEQGKKLGTKAASRSRYFVHQQHKQASEVREGGSES
jgi:hypothetical protein